MMKCGIALLSLFLNRQNALFDVRCWAFDVRCSLVSFLIKLAAIQASESADPPAAEHQPARVARRAKEGHLKTGL
jgi:hypothetical protein